MVWVNLTVALVRNADGAPQYEISVMEDITERKEREVALQRFRTALDSSADMVFLFDLSAGKLLDFNQTAAHLLGYTREELLDLRARDIRPAATHGTLRTETAELMSAAGHTHTVMTEYRRKDGSTFQVESRRAPPARSARPSRSARRHCAWKAPPARAWRSSSGSAPAPPGASRPRRARSCRAS
jgi:PAS domain S-box-containing protein